MKRELTLEKRGQYYYLRVQVDGRRTYRSTGETTLEKARPKAKELYKKYQEEVRKPQIRSTTISLTEAAEKMYEEEWVELRAGEEQYRKVLRIAEILGDPTLDAIDEVSIGTVKKTLKHDKLSNTTVNRYVACLKTIMRMAEKHWKVNCRVPAFKMFKELPGRIYEVSPEEEQRIIECLKNAQGNRYMRTREMADLVVLLLDSGLRLGEALQLTYRDNIELSGKVLHLYSDQTKAKKERVVPMTDRVYDMLVKRQERYKTRPFPFTKDHCENTWQYVRRTLENWDKSFVIHAFRHTCAKRLLRAGVDLYMVCKILGHSTTKVTERYLEGMASTDMRNAVAKLNRAMLHAQNEAAMKAQSGDPALDATDATLMPEQEAINGDCDPASTSNVVQFKARTKRK
ncbi:MAG: site-specific integrase [Syntrophobacteraceae bacterium]